MKKPVYIFGICLLAISLLLVGCGQATSVPPDSAATTAPTTVPAKTVERATITSAPNPQPTTTPLAEIVPSNAEPLVIRFVDFYTPDSPPVNPQLSQKMLAAKDKRIKIVGYMAPPLKPDLDFFVLTKIRLVVCPFCSKEAEWPNDIILVTLTNGRTMQHSEEPLVVVGKLEVGGAYDKETGFYSLLRLRAENIEPFKG
jgi:hypothetical protein